MSAPVPPFRAVVSANRDGGDWVCMLDCGHVVRRYGALVSRPAPQRTRCKTCFITEATNNDPTWHDDPCPACAGWVNSSGKSPVHIVGCPRTDEATRRAYAAEWAAYQEGYRTVNGGSTPNPTEATATNAPSVVRDA